MALSTTAEWWGSAIISNLVDTAYSYLAQHMLPDDTKAELRRVKAALPKISAVMSVAESLKFRYPNSGVNAWVQQFKEAFLAAEDLLDELEYRKLEDMVKNRNQVSGSSSSIIGSLKRKFTSSTISEDTLKRLREAVEMLDLAIVDVGHFFQFATALGVDSLAKPNNEHVYPSNRETTSLLTERKVFGRETEKAIIIEWLKKPASHGNISAFCIVGVGGLGKTTLAQLIFEEISRENHFDKTIWVCVSTNFSVEDITRKILQELGEKGHENESLNCLQINLKKKILSKKVLFILDDVWNDEKMCDWEKLIAPLKFVQQRSKILLTTRMKSVADMLARVLNLERENLVLEGLEEKEVLNLLNEYAFSGYNPDSYKELQKIGNDIVKQLRGNPLAAKVIGGLLNSYMDIHYWKRILNNDLLVNLEQAKDVANVLKLSYYHLPAQLQECFRFCCIFAQDNLFVKDELIKMWIASGFIRQELHEGEMPEVIGEEYINLLFRKSFFEMWRGYYVIHDLMHDLAKNISKGECCRVERNRKSDNILETVQHVSVPGCKIERIFNLRNLRTLVITLYDDDQINEERFVPPNDSLKKTLRLLLIKGNYSCELPKQISSLLHLRFLKVNLPIFYQSYKYLLHNSIYKLYHLQVLEMYSLCSTSEEGVETSGMTNLVSLRYMKLPNWLMRKIKGVHKLTSLQELDFFVGRECGHHIDELQMLNNLRYLSIETIEDVGEPVEATNANLSKKESLITLSLNWTRGCNSNNPEQVIDNLRPNPNLKDLSINYYTGHRYPDWMRVSSHLHLSSLKLKWCSLWEVLPSVGQMPYLKELFLCEMYEVKEVDYSCDSTSDCAFPSLEKLDCRYMPKWESWAGSHISYGFPNLKELIIEDCPNLEKLPYIPLSLLRFEVRNVGLNSLPDIHNSSSITTPTSSCMKSSLRVVEITKCPKLIALNGFLQQQNLDLQFVEELTIKDCENLLQLPIDGFGKLTSLKNLTIENNPELVAVDFQSNLIPVKLQELTMGNCGVLDVPLCEASFGLTNLTQLKISGSSNITPITLSENAFTSLECLEINGCPNLTKLPNLPLSLNRFTISHVPVSDLPEYFQSSHSSGPTSSSPTASLRNLKINNCSNLTSLTGFLQQENIDLQYLETLEIDSCENLVRLPTGAFGKFGSLQNLGIMGCPKLVEIASMHQAHTVNLGNNLISVKIIYLEIDHLCLLLLKPLRCLRFVSSLIVDQCSGMEALPEQWLLQNSRTLKKLCIIDASSLRSLPGTIVMLSALEHLGIRKATLLEEIPELPTSLKYKNIQWD